MYSAVTNSHFNYLIFNSRLAGFGVLSQHETFGCTLSIVTAARLDSQGTKIGCSNVITTIIGADIS